MANHKQAKKRARQSERRRQRNMNVKSTVRTLIKQVRYSAETIRHLDSGRQVHPQEAEKQIRSALDNREEHYRTTGHETMLVQARNLLENGRVDKAFNREMHRSFLVSLARADMHIACRALDKAASKGVFHRRNASRRISRLQRLVNVL